MNDIELEKINYALTILKKSDNLKQAIEVYCIDLEDKYNDVELELITKCVEESILILKEFIDEIKNNNINENDLNYTILALQHITKCYNLITGYIQENYKKYTNNDKSIKKKNITNLIIYLSICFGTNSPYDDLLKKIWKEQGENILEGIMIVKKWAKNTISKCCF